MSKKHFILNILVFIFLFLSCTFGQQDDPRSKKIIDDMTAKFKSYTNVSFDFSVTIETGQEISETKQEGKIWVKSAAKYKIELPDVVIYFDGSKEYRYLPPPVNEVTIGKPDPDDNDFQLLNPLNQ